MKPRKLLAVLIISAGLIIMVRPWLISHYYEQEQNQIMAQWLGSSSGGVLPLEEECLPAQTVPASEREEVYSAAEEHKLFSEISTSSVFKYSQENAEGVLYIDSIDLQCPILFGESEKNLNLAICRLYGSAEPGGYGNYCLSGHNSRIYGRLFNRLKEVRQGDIIIVQTDDEFYHYEAADIFSVTADDTIALEHDYTKKEITLITCDYGQRPTGRLIVKGMLAEGD